MTIYWTRERSEELADKMIDASIERNLEMVKYLEKRPEPVCRELATKLRLLIELKKQIN